MCHGIPREGIRLDYIFAGHVTKKGISSSENAFCGGGKECHPAVGS